MTLTLLLTTDPNPNPYPSPDPNKAARLFRALAPRPITRLELCCDEPAALKRELGALFTEQTLTLTLPLTPTLSPTLALALALAYPKPNPSPSPNPHQGALFSELGGLDAPQHNGLGSFSLVQDRRSPSYPAGLT